jgi:hypothetical protein
LSDAFELRARLRYSQSARLCYETNRANGVLFDPVTRGVHVGELLAKESAQWPRGRIAFGPARIISLACARPLEDRR